MALEAQGFHQRLRIFEKNIMENIKQTEAQKTSIR